MENKASKKIKWLMMIILLLFLIPSGIDLVDGFSEGWNSFEEGMEEGMATAQEGNHGKHLFFVKVEPLTDQAPKQIGDGSQFISLSESGKLRMTENMNSFWWVRIVEVLLAFTVLIALVCFIVMLFRFAARIPRQRIMAEQNIGSLRRIAYALGIVSLGGYLMEVIETLWLCSHVSLTGYKIVMPMPPAALIVALIILVMTEILKLGHKLQQEQDLTI